ncbi:MAG: hypothetical protein GWQ08_14560, partial [Verrucomicrobiaceae bacterium]|nr:hypothetical protein [Verrucomicrobiaceae bacterium]
MNKTRFFASLAASVLLLVSFTGCYYDSHYYDYNSVYDDGYYGSGGYYDTAYTTNIYYPRSISGGYYGSPFFRNYTTYYHAIGGVRCPYYLYNGRRYYHKADHHRRYGHRTYKEDRNRRDRYDRGGRDRNPTIDGRNKRPTSRGDRTSNRGGTYVTNSGRGYNQLSGNETKYVPNSTSSVRSSGRSSVSS